MSENCEFVIKGNFGGYYDENGHFVVCEEYGLSDRDTDRFAIDIMNDDGFYNNNGHFVGFRSEV